MNWGFYGRRDELREIKNIISSGNFFFCVVRGRRRIGKTSLIARALEEVKRTNNFYVQIPDSDEYGVAQVFSEALEDWGKVTGNTAPQITNFSAIAAMLAALWKQDCL